jgi:hypothetical protein
MARPRKEELDSPVDESIEEKKESMTAVEEDPQTQVVKSKIQYRRIEPRRKFKPIGTLDEKFKKDHAHDWEYVEGIYENMLEPGHQAEFWFVKYPGDPDCEWVIPANVPVSIPRMIAKHLESIDCYHKFGFVDKPPQLWSPDEFTSTFTVTSKHFRSKFRSMGAFD